MAGLLAALLGCASDDTPEPDATTSPPPAQTAAGQTPPGQPLPGQTPPGQPSGAQTPSATASEPAASTAPTVSAGAWRSATPAPQPLTEVAAAAFGGSVWVVGGLDAQGQAVSTVQVYDPTFDSWSEGPALPRALHHAALVAAGDRLYLLGGYLGAGFEQPSPEVFVLPASTGMWEPGPPLPEARAAGAAAWDGQRVVYGGGVGPNRLSADVWALADDVWEPLGELWQAREHLAAVSDGAGRVWLLGGRTGGLDTNLAAVDIVVGDQVSAAGALPTARGGVAGFYGGPSLGACAVGGEGPNGTFAAVQCVDATGRATALPPLSVPRHGLGAVRLEGVAIALLGGPEPGLSVSGAVEVLPLPAAGA